MLIHGIRTLARVVFRFVADDSLYAAMTIVWIRVATLARHATISRPWAELLLAIGLDAIFVASVILRASHISREKPGQAHIPNDK
jgi:hypothetical protein